MGDDEQLRAVAASPEPAGMPPDVLTAMFPGVANLETEKRGVAKTAVDGDG